MSKSLKALKLGTAIACTLCFIINSFVTFQMFFKGSSLVLLSIQENSELPLPVMILCSQSAFKAVDQDGIMGWSKEKYLEQTMDPFKIDVNVATFNRANGQRIELENVKLRKLNTMFSGSCLTIDIERRVS